MTDEEGCPRHEEDSWLDDLIHRVEQTWAYFHEHSDLCELDDDEPDGCDCDEYGWFISWNAKQTSSTFPVTVFKTRV